MHRSFLSSLFPSLPLISLLALVAFAFGGCTESVAIGGQDSGTMRPDASPDASQQDGNTGEPCGPVTCGPGTECCNASCGICVEPGQTCTEQACTSDGGQPQVCGDTVCMPDQTCCTGCNGETLGCFASCPATACDGGTSPGCEGPNPQGCRFDDTNCGPGYRCDTNTDVCAPSSCTCNDGTWSCTEDCGGGECVPDDSHCAAMDAQGTGTCLQQFGFKWDGQQCVLVGGCGCEGSDCDALYDSEEQCRAAHPDCPTGNDCGGFSGQSCESYAWCDYADDAPACGGADALGECKIRPETCPEIFSPVCGCDGTTYSSECHAHGAGVDIASTGECDS